MKKYSEKQIEYWKSMKGRKASKETRNKLSMLRKGEKHPNYGKHPSKESRLKMSLSHKGVIPSKETIEKRRMAMIGKNLGKKRSKEFCEKMRIHNLGRVISIEQRIRQSESMKGKNLGKKPSKEQIEKMRLSHLGKKLSKEQILKIVESRKGYKHSDETKRKISIHHKQLWNKPEMKEFARIQRSKIVFPLIDTKIEIKIQNYLKELKIEFFTHIYIEEIEHRYQCDILIPIQKSNTFFIKQPIIIECDGDYWHGNIKTEFKNRPRDNNIMLKVKNDIIRTKELQDKGFRVIRLWEHEIKKMNLEDLNNLVINNYE